LIELRNYLHLHSWHYIRMETVI